MLLRQPSHVLLNFGVQGAESGQWGFENMLVQGAQDVGAPAVKRAGEATNPEDDDFIAVVKVGRACMREWSNHPHPV